MRRKAGRIVRKREWKGRKKYTEKESKSKRMERKRKTKIKRKVRRIEKKSDGRNIPGIKSPITRRRKENKTLQIERKEN